LELKQFKMEKEQRIPTLSEVLNLINQNARWILNWKAMKLQTK
jgi:hypothetical protein